MIDIDTIKEEVTIAEVLAHYGASVGGYGYGQWRPVNCPFCRDSNGSGSVNLTAGRFLCHQCGAPRDGSSGDVIDVVAYAENLSMKEAIAWIQRTLM